MKSLLRTTALVSVLGLALPTSALSNDADMQTQIQSGSGAAANSELSTPAGSAEMGASAGTAAGTASELGAQADIDLMAQVEQLRMVDITDVQIVRVDSEEAVRLSQRAEPAMPSGAAVATEPMVTGSIGSAGAFSAQPGADSGAAGSATAGAATAGAATAGSTLPVPPEATAELDSAFASEITSDTETTASSGYGTDAELGAEASAGGFDTTITADTGAATGYGTSPDSTAGGSFDAAGQTGGGAGAASQAGTARAFSSNFVADNLNQIPQIADALEENNVVADDIVSIDVGEGGQVTIYVRDDA